ncbi:uncharacterized protein K452DRAFT_301959 [Aplosporella prunicola CBS 121167]|uniref:Uncharacterized protein n=1 Tax=Aplosporella prunicola CBS 121167 TaxID=1176127 RepID=A0A6A6B2X7_9PEZI|nr:uncharacterized protein K452DRAFT_301959 [Aplosporella prunicola CBS 121167]KAF2137367.1 hypothetical protein K452DRAFT_301959 [Aplosporella prunicola CBS 121167]
MEAHAAETDRGVQEAKDQSTYLLNERESSPPPLITHTSNPTKQSYKYTLHIILVLLTLVIPIVALAAWLATSGIHARFKTFHGEEIGGHLTQAQAKALDVVSGAVLAPLVMAGLNLVWFAVARVAVVKEEGEDTRKYPPASNADSFRRGIPLSSLVAASQSSSGTYDLLHLWTLLRGRTMRLVSLVLLCLFSALGRSALANLVAYEAFFENVASPHPYQLRYMRDAVIESSVVIPTSLQMDVFGFNTEQQASVANQMSGMLTGLNFQNATKMLESDGSYVGVNTTAAALDALPASVVGLVNVPGFRVSVECAPAQLSNLAVLAMGAYDTSINGIADTTLFRAQIPGPSSVLKGASNDVYSFVAFDFNTTNAFLGYLTSFDYSNYTIATPYGTLNPTVANMTSSGFTGTKATMSVWGLQCSLYQQSGQLNLTRAHNSDVTIAAATFAPETEKMKIPSALATWQANLNYHAPTAAIPGIGPALARTACPATASSADSTLCSAGQNSTDFAALARNFLYASAEARTIAIEVAASNATREKPEYVYTVQAVVTRQFYRMTYVPVVLAVGLASLVLAALVVGGMAWVARGSEAVGGWRVRDVGRVVVDAVAGLGGERGGGAEVGCVAAGSNEGVARWTEGCRVVYERAVDGERVARVRLRRVGEKGGEGVVC